ncbi:hypothetical protein PORY_000717 [Pneumocystis oryctolagi]|uniref:Uncharacterized protein n=1 Tax=Pneumocystis oryctolagi TaxID=42067 RepID=A0ACB7CDH3_9ASCO|nr:hypothetical protein PORY_000717 [Pneumocystis oryctolagi]
MNCQDAEDSLKKTQDLKEFFKKLSISVKKKNAENPKSSNEIQIKTSDTKSIKSQVIELIKHDRYSEALDTILKELFPEEMQFEIAYCLFMLERFEDALHCIGESNNRSLLHIKAQIEYLMDHSMNSIQLYQKLIQDPYRVSNPIIENENFDLNVNLLAAQVTFSSIEICNDPSIYQSLDYRFNIGCHLIQKKEYEKAKALFELSREQCLSTIHQEDMESRLYLILSQLAYVYSFIGQESEALNIYENLMNKENIDPIIKLIATNNILSIKPIENNYSAFYSMNSALSNVKLSKLTSVQNKIIEKNMAILNMLCEKYSACYNIVKKLQNKYPDDNTIILILVSSILSQFTGNHACTKLMELHKKTPSNIPLSLAIIQFMISSKNNNNAQKIMEELLNSLKDNKNLRFSPGLVRLAMEIYEKQGKIDLAHQELFAASEYWRSTGNNDHNLIELLYASGKLKLKNIISKKKNSNLSPIDDFTYLLKISPNNQKVLAGMAVYYFNTDIDEALKYSDKLPAPDTLIQGVNIDYLEKSGVIDFLSKKKENKESKPSLKQKRKRSKLPQNYDPNKQPDPERWIPKKLRSSYKPPKGKKKISNRTQGELPSQNNSTKQYR